MLKFLIILLVINNCYSYDLVIGFINDTTLSTDMKKEIEETYDDFIVSLKDVLDKGVSVSTHSIKYPDGDKKFSDIWTEFKSVQVTVVISYCNFIFDESDIIDFEIIGKNEMILVCGSEDYLSICLDNVFFFSSSKAVMYRCIYIII